MKGLPYSIRTGLIPVILLIATIATCLQGCNQPEPPDEPAKETTLLKNVMDLKKAPVWDNLEPSVYEFMPVAEPSEDRFEAGLYYMPEADPMERKAELWRIDLDTFRKEKVLDLQAITGAVHDFVIGPDGRFLYILFRLRTQDVNMTDLMMAARRGSEYDRIDIMRELMLDTDRSVLMVYDIASSDYVRCEKTGDVVDGVTLLEQPDFGLWPRRIHPAHIVLPAYDGYSQTTGFNFQQFIAINLRNLDILDFTVPYSGFESAGSEESRPEVIRIETSATDFFITGATLFSFAYDGSYLCRRIFDTSTRLYSSETKLKWPVENSGLNWAQNDLSPLICALVRKDEDGNSYSTLNVAWDNDVFEITDFMQHSGAETFRGAFFIDQTAFIIPVNKTKSGGDAEFEIVKLDINSGETDVIFEYTGKYGSMSPMDFTADLEGGLFAGAMQRLSDGTGPGVGRLFIYDVASGEIIKIFESERGFSRPRFFVGK